MSEVKDNMFCSCLYYSANALARLMTKLADDAFATTGLSPSYAFLLMIVNKKPGIQPGDIALQMQLTPSTVTRLIDKMEQKGYLERRGEGRQIYVDPTDKSQKMQELLLSSWKALYKNYTNILGEDLSKELTDKNYLAVMKLN